MIDNFQQFIFKYLEFIKDNAMGLFQTDFSFIDEYTLEDLNNIIEKQEIPDSAILDFKDVVLSVQRSFDFCRKLPKDYLKDQVEEFNDYKTKMTNYIKEYTKIEFVDNDRN